MTRPNSDYKLAFGKHAGQALKDIPESYLKWIAAKKIGECAVYGKVLGRTDRALIKYLGIEDNILIIARKV